MSLDEGFNGFTQFILALEAGSIQPLALQQTKHDFDLVEPTRRSRREVECHSLFVFGEPIVVPLVSRGIIQDHMDLLIRWQFRQHAIKETQKVFPLLEFSGLGVDVAGTDFKSGEQIQRAVTFVGALQGTHHHATGGLHVPAEPLSR